MPANCPLLKDLNLKLVNGPPTPLAPASADSPAPAPVASPPAASPPAASPGGRVASADTPVSSGSGATPSGLIATVEEDEYRSDEDMFRSVSLYPSSFHVSVVPTASHLPSTPLPSSSSCLVLPDHLQGNGYSVLLAVCSAICPANFWSRSANLYGAEHFGE